MNFDEVHDKTDIIQALRDDNNYYGEFGRNFISASDIKVLVSSPDMYGVGTDDSLNLLKGTYMHRRLLQPETLGDMIIVDATTRTIKAYKEVVDENSIEGQPKPVFLLRHETNEMDILAKKAESNHAFVDGLQANKRTFEVEEPMIGELFGYWFKGKADRINTHRGFVADIKTTRSLSSFVRGFRSLGYHAQAYVYKTLFGLPVRFFVISKEDGRLGIYDVSDETLQQGEEYVKWGLERLEMYYGDNPTKDINQYYDYSLL